MTEIFKTLNDINPNYMKEMFYLSPHEKHKKYYLFVHSHKHNTTKYGTYSLRVPGPHIWTSSPEKIKKLSLIFSKCIQKLAS